mgnify:CR=1 FL=1
MKQLFLALFATSTALNSWAQPDSIKVIEGIQPPRPYVIPKPYINLPSIETYVLVGTSIQEKRLNGNYGRDVQVITKKDIQSLPVRSVNELLGYLSGLDIRERGPFGAQADLSMMGAGFEQCLILINGVPMRDPQTGHHMLNLPVDLSQIERIEVMNGTAGRIYGSNALPEQSTSSLQLLNPGLHSLKPSTPQPLRKKVLLPTVFKPWPHSERENHNTASHWVNSKQMVTDTIQQMTNNASVTSGITN